MILCSAFTVRRFEHNRSRVGLVIIFHNAVSSLRFLFTLKMNLKFIFQTFNVFRLPVSLYNDGILVHRDPSRQQGNEFGVSVVDHALLIFTFVSVSDHFQHTHIFPHLKHIILASLLPLLYMVSKGCVRLHKKRKRKKK